MELDLEAYAVLAAMMAAAPERRDHLLKEHGLDEEQWEAIDDHWQDMLSEAMDDDDGDGVPALIAQFTAASSRAREQLSVPLGLELYAQITRQLQATGDLTATLAKAGVSLAAYTHASEHWNRSIVLDPELERRFVSALEGRCDDDRSR